VNKPVGVLRFLGTNCDRDVWQAVEAVGLTPKWLWFQDLFSPADFSALIVPGGFSYGDYLRCGALAAKSPAMKAVREAAGKGLPILGICNGFQILCEAELLPGALVRNEKRKFIDRWVELKCESTTPWTAKTKKGAALKLPIAHGEGRFYAEKEALKQIQDQGQVWFTYRENPNGALEDIAGVTNVQKNVCGLMPHPERAMWDWMGGADGRAILESVVVN
jgi:phosphoribosylformylglycinamidine synthase subunit PurQ / glutaminase